MKILKSRMAIMNQQSSINIPIEQFKNDGHDHHDAVMQWNNDNSIVKKIKRPTETANCIVIRMFLLLQLFILSAQVQAQVYLGLNQKEGILISEDSSMSESEFMNEQSILKNFPHGSNIIVDEFMSEYSELTDLRIGDTFYVACQNNTAVETVSGYMVYNSSDYKEFDPLISNRSKLCPFENFQHEEFHKDLVVVSKKPIRNRLSFSSPVPFDMIERIKSRVLTDVKHFEVETDVLGSNDMNDLKREFVSEVTMQDLRIFRGSFCNKYAQEYFVSYTRRESFGDYINVNYVMDTLANVISYFTTPRIVFEYRKIVGKSDYDNNCFDEIIINVGYYEGEGYELWNFSKGTFTKIAEGFYAGV